MKIDLDTVSDARLPFGQFDVLRGEWAKPISFNYFAESPVISTLFIAPSYLIEGRFSASSKIGYIPVGNTFMIPPEHEFQARGTGGAIRVARYTFDRHAYETLVKPDFQFTDAEMARSLDLTTTTISLLMQQLIKEVASPGFASEILLESISSMLLIECGRHIFRSTEQESRVPRAGLQTRHLLAIEDYLENLETGVPGIAELAELSGFSAHYFSKLFRQATGQSLGRYVGAWRMRRAQCLLVDTSLPLKEIAFRLGFANAANFSTAFSKELGKTPGAFRKAQVVSYAVRPILCH